MRVHEPLIPLLDTTLLTNAPGEPRVGRQIARRSTRPIEIDIVMAFIRRSGIAAAARSAAPPLRTRAGRCAF